MVATVEASVETLEVAVFGTPAVPVVGMFVWAVSSVVLELVPKNHNHMDTTFTLSSVRFSG